MQLGMIGLGRMGANMVRRLVKGGHHCVIFDVSPKVEGGRRDSWVSATLLGSPSLATNPSTNRSRTTASSIACASAA